MTVPYTLQFATYTFPNATFKLADHRLDIDTPSVDVRRRDGGVTIQGFLKQKRWRINGKLYGTDEGSVHSALNIMSQSLHNRGIGASFLYMADRYAFASLAPGGLTATPEEGLNGYLYNMDIALISDPFVEAITVSRKTGTRVNNSAIDTVAVGGNYPAAPVFTFVGGTWAFNSPILVQNLANSYFFQYSGPVIAGQTIIVDCAAGSVLLQVGVTMIESISHFGGNLDFILEPNVTNDLMISGATLSYAIDYRNRWYV